MSRRTPWCAATVILTMAACSSADRPSIGQPVPPAAPTTTLPEATATATTTPGAPNVDIWPDAIDVPPDADPCAFLTDVLIEAAVGTGGHEPTARDGSRCRATNGDDELSVEIRDYGGAHRDVAGARYQQSHPTLTLEPIESAPTPIVYSAAQRETAVFLVSSMLLFEFSDLADQQAFFDALIVAMRRSGTD